MAEQTVILNNLQFTLSEDQTFYSVRKADAVEIGYELRIPAEIEGLPVKEIEAEGFASDTSINIVIIPESVIKIGDRAFKDCTSLQGIVIPRTVENYGSKIFENVPKSFRILHSEFETSILSETDDRLAFTLSDDGTFYYVKRANYEISGDIEIPAEYNGLPVKEIDNWGFGYCTSLTSITIPDGVTSIGYNAFIGCNLLNSINIPDSVTSIEDYAFYSCFSLTSITIPDGVTSIEYCTFYHCSKLTLVTIGNSVTSIGDSAFINCESLTSITIPNSVTSIGEGAFNGCKALTSISIPDSVTSIEHGAFNNCIALTSITVDPDNTVYKSDGNCIIEKATNTLIVGCKTSVIPNYVTSIGNFAFSGCSFTSITIPDGVTSIGKYAFSGCSALTSITIPDSVTSIGDSAFQGCSALKTVILGKGLETLYGTANYNGSFRNCTALTTVINKSDNLVTPDNEYVFYNCNNLTKVYFTSTTAGYVDGGTWCGRTLEYMKWNGTDTIAIDAEASNFTTTDETVTVDKITNTYERYTDTDPDGNTFSQDTGNYVFKYDNLTDLWICMNYYGGPQIKCNDTSYYQFCWLGTHGSEYTQYYNIVQCDSNTHEILNDIIPDLSRADFAYTYSSYNFVEQIVDGGSN